MSKQIKEPLKNLIIVLLLACALILGGKTGIFDELFRSVPLFVKIEELFSLKGQAEEQSGHNQLDLHEAASPVDIILTDKDGRHFGIQNDGAALKETYEKLTNVLREALGSASVPVEINRGQWENALAIEGIFFDFYNEMPLSVLIRWLDPDMEMTNNSRHMARRICIADSQIYYINEEGRFYKCATAAVLNDIAPMLNNGVYHEAGYAFEMGELYARLNPYNIIYIEPTDKFKIKAENRLSSSETLKTVLTAFRINPGSNAKYEINGTVKYVEDDAELYVYSDGQIYYETLDKNGLKSLSGATQETGELIESARDIVMKLLRGSTGDEALYYTGIKEISEQVYEVNFDYFINGSEIVIEGHAATVTIAGGSVKAVKLYLKSYKMTGEKVVLLPFTAAAVTVQKYPGSELCLKYVDKGGDLLSPEMIVK